LPLEPAAASSMLGCNMSDANPTDKITKLDITRKSAGDVINFDLISLLGFTHYEKNIVEVRIMH